jgi:hypothetical protein
MEKKSGRIIFQQNVKEENELLKSKESENQKSHKSLRIKLDLFDKTKLHLDKQNIFKNLYNRKIKVIHSKINLSPKNQAQMFLTIQIMIEINVELFKEQIQKKIKNQLQVKINKLLLQKLEEEWILN